MNRSDDHGEGQHDRIWLFVRHFPNRLIHKSLVQILVNQIAKLDPPGALFPPAYLFPSSARWFTERDIFYILIYSHNSCNYVLLVIILLQNQALSSCVP